MGAIVDGMPAGIAFEPEIDLQPHLDRRRPGQSKITTSRSEPDQAEILSGIFEGKTLGSPICVVVRNTNARSQDYDQKYFRAGHADRVWEEKFGHRDYRGGGRASGRETLSRVIGGAFARKILGPEILLQAFTRQIGPFRAEKLPPTLTLEEIDAHPTRCPDPGIAAKISADLERCKEEGDSRGGIIELWIDGLPLGLGEPVFWKLKNALADAFMSVGAVVGVGLGDPHEAAMASGKEFHTGIAGAGPEAGLSPAAQGIQGGISNGERLRFSVYFKPASTVGSMAKQGRHDPCIVPRAVPVIEAMAALVLADFTLARRLNQF